MSNAQYLWSVAWGLRTQVRPSVTDASARDALDNGVRILTSVANALEWDPAADGSLVDTDRLGGPPENAAAHRDTGRAIASAAAGLDAGLPPAMARDAIAWEKALIDAALTRIDAVERAGPASGDTGASIIDPARLQAYLRQLPGCADVEITTFRLIAGGRSRQTALFSISGGSDLPADMVIQRGIPGQAGSAAFLGEAAQHALLSRLHAAGMRVPRPVLVEEGLGWLDAPFLLSEQVPGAPVQPDYWLPADDEQVVLGLAREMALLHAQSVDGVGAGLHVPRGAGGDWPAELEELASAWTDNAHWPSITMSAAIAWLRAHVGDLDDRRAIVHNDMLFHNILAQDGAITAVLDWEQCAIGHPGEDLGYCYPAVIAVTDWSRFMQAYRGAGGADIPQRQIDYFALRAGLRLMKLVMAGGRDSFEKGLSDDVLVASAGAHFTQRLLHRIALTLHSILERDA